MDKYFDNFYNFSQFGPAIKPTSLTTAVANAFAEKLPAQLIEYWRQYGFCGWGEGLFWTVNPANYEEVLGLWLKDTPFEKSDKYYVIGRSAFGTLLVWGETSGQSMRINCSYAMLFPTDNTAELKKWGGDLSVQLFFAALDKFYFDLEDEDDKPLFAAALKKLGELDADEMYAFVPAIPLGGAVKLENLQKVKILAHLSFLAELGEKTVQADVTI